MTLIPNIVYSSSQRKIEISGKGFIGVYYYKVLFARSISVVQFKLIRIIYLCIFVLISVITFADVHSINH